MGWGITTRSSRPIRFVGYNLRLAERTSRPLSLERVYKPPVPSAPLLLLPLHRAYQVKKCNANFYGGGMLKGCLERENGSAREPLWASIDKTLRSAEVSSRQGVDQDSQTMTDNTGNIRPRTTWKEFSTVMEGYRDPHGSETGPKAPPTYSTTVSWQPSGQDDGVGHPLHR